MIFFFLLRIYHLFLAASMFSYSSHFFDSSFFNWYSRSILTKSSWSPSLFLASDNYLDVFYKYLLRFQIH